MTDDLVKRLRAIVPTVYDAHDAADEIERLQARVDKLEKDLGCADAYQREWEQHCKTAEARAEELEANINIKADFIDATINQLSASDQHIEELESKLAKAVELAEKYQHAFAAQSRKLQAVLHIDGVRATLAELTGGRNVSY